MPITNLIPITSFVNSDSVFLTVFLNNAVGNDQTLLDYNEYGGVSCPRADIVGFEHGDDPEYFSTSVVDKFPGATVPKKFISVAVHVDSILYLFDKSIKITISEENAEELALEFLGKFIINIKHEPETVWMDIYNERMAMVPYTNPYFLSNSEDILNISKTELMTGSAADLISKISTYTDIPIENFNAQNLINWREATARGIIKTKDQLIALK